MDFILQEELLDFSDGTEGFLLIDEPERDGFCVDQLKKSGVMDDGVEFVAGQLFPFLVILS
jgi:hypothetical protein